MIPRLWVLILATALMPPLIGCLVQPPQGIPTVAGSEIGSGVKRVESNYRLPLDLPLNYCLVGLAKVSPQRPLRMEDHKGLTLFNPRETFCPWILYPYCCSLRNVHWVPNVCYTPLMFGIWTVPKGSCVKCLALSWWCHLGSSWKLARWDLVGRSRS